MRNKRTIAVDISNKVRQVVKERDKWCVVCGSPYNLQVAHFIPRSKGGLGIEQNLVLLCFRCHMQYDQSSKRKQIEGIIEDYLRYWYKDLDKNKMIYRKD